MTDIIASVLIGVFLLTLVGAVFWVAFHTKTPDITLPERKDEE